MKKILCSVLLFSLLFVVCGNVVDSATKTTAQKPIQGQVVSLHDVIMGVKDLQLNREKAEELYEQKIPLVFKVGNKIYFVQNDDGSFAFKKLVGYAMNKKVGIVGKTKVVNGINVIVMTSIDAMD